MDLSSNDKYMETSSFFSSHHVGAERLELGAKNPFLLDSYYPPAAAADDDPLCELNLKETSDFVRSLSGFGGVGDKNNAAESRGILEFSAAQRGRDGGGGGSVARRLLAEAPPTPGRPVFGFSHGGSFARKSFPSKWDDAEKWLSSCHDSPGAADHGRPFETYKAYNRQCSGYKPQLCFAEKTTRVVLNEEKMDALQGKALMLNHHKKNSLATAVDELSLSSSAGLLLKDKFPNEPPLQESFLFGNRSNLPDASKHRDAGTEMTPLGSSTTSRCPTPFKSPSPARHNTPENRSGPLAAPASTGSSSNTVELQECHLAKLSSLGTMNNYWSSREEEEEDVSKSLRHFEMSAELRKSVSEHRAAAPPPPSSCLWEEDKAKSCLRYQREQAKIQAWVHLQSAKAEAESRKLEVKIQKMRSNLEEKLMKRMASVQRKAEEWRAEAQFHHSNQVRKISQQRKAAAVANRNKIQFSGSNKSSCGCFLPCSSNSSSSNNTHI